ncbi:MAG TPA: primosomal protein N' [Vicinamibacterales bacterium]|nr:primosomal protein N' [Vicinamibacterales bacterium]
MAVPVPGIGALTYAVPDGFPDPPIGARVLVPLGKRTLTGIVIAQGSDPGLTPFGRGEAVEVRPLVDVLETEPFLPAHVVELATWVADYYAAGVGEAIATAMPPRAWIESERHVAITDAGEARLLVERGARREMLEHLTGGRVVSVAALSRKAKGAAAIVAALEADGCVSLTRPLKGTADASRTVRVAVLTAQGAEQTEIKLGVRQQQALDLLRGAPDGMPLADLADEDIPSESVARLAQLGLVTIERRRVERDPFESGADRIARAAVLDLTDEQQAAVRTLAARAAANQYHVALLHGVTGSGKTEIYLRLARDVRASGRGVLLMVPEIALTPAAAAIFRAAFGPRVAIQHSGLSDGERYDQWQRIRRGEIDVVVGTRSAVFTPLPNLGLIVVDEEHDASYKQEESPRYNGRDVAVVRGRAAGALVVLGSATPSLESYHNAENGRYELVSLQRRVLDRPMASVAVVDMRAEFAAEGPGVILSTPLRDALASRLERGEQAIVLLNRRGYATVVFCRQCGDTLECPNCSVSLTVHKAAGRARCHYCNYATGLPKVCGKCAGPYLEQLGFGTERIEAELRAAFPQARVGRVDRDTVRRRGAIASMLASFANKELDVLVGTQMIAKGHDFPRVTLVGVISADVGLGLADFRAAERTFQLLTQVAGRAGRGEIAGEAVVQTLYPSHYSIRHACRQDYGAFYEDEMKFRRAMRYPPAVALINVIVKAKSRQQAMDDAGTIAEGMRLPGFDAWRVLGPAPAPLGRLKGEHRAQIFIKGTHRTAMRKALLTVLEARPELKRRTIVDVDPMTVL